MRSHEIGVIERDFVKLSNRSFLDSTNIHFKTSKILYCKFIIFAKKHFIHKKLNDI